MKIVIAIDSFKGSLTSKEAGEDVKKAILLRVAFIFEKSLVQYSLTEHLHHYALLASIYL